MIQKKKAVNIFQLFVIFCIIIFIGILIQNCWFRMNSKLNNNNNNGQNSYNFQEICQWNTSLNNESIYGKCIAPFNNFIGRYRLAHKYKLNYCVIEKSMSLVMRSMMCFLNHPEEYKKRNINILNETLYNSPICNTTNIWEVWSHNGTFNEFEDYYFFTLIRDPIERLISSYVDKCLTYNDTPFICYNCKGNFNCLIDRLYERAINFDPSVPIDQHTYDDYHFFPQTWLCNFNTLFNKIKIIKYIVHRGQAQLEMFESLFKIYRQNGVPEDYISYFKQKINAERTKHSTTKRPEREHVLSELKENRVLRLKLLQIYYFDYLIFKFNIPVYNVL